MQEGYIMLYRKLKKSPYYSDSHYIHLWLHLLLSVNHAPARIKIRGTHQFLDLNPGQFLTSRDTLSRDTGINRSKVDRILKVFESEQQIEQVTTSKYRVISVTNWDKHQNVSKCLSNKRATSEQQVSTNNNEKKDKNIFVCPTVEEVRQYCQERNNGVDPNKWHDFYTSKKWYVGKNKMADWQACVRTWEKTTQTTFNSMAGVK